MKIENIDVNSYPGSEKVYIDGELHPIKVAMRRVNLMPTVRIVDGEKLTRQNAPVYVYDTSGVYTDPAVKVDINEGLPRIREEWTAASMRYASPTATLPCAPRRERQSPRWPSPAKE